MTEVAEAGTAPDTGSKRSKRGLILGLLFAAALGGGGFYAVFSGLVDPASLLGRGSDGGGDGAAPPAALEDVAFVPLEPVVISLPPGASARLLRFSGQLEVEPERAAEIEALMPRVLDVLNGYLRAVEVRELEDPSAMMRLRAQMLRRVQLVTGEGGVRDLLVTEFVLS